MCRNEWREIPSGSCVAAAVKETVLAAPWSERALQDMYRVYRYEAPIFIACTIHARALTWFPNHLLEPQMKPRVVAKDEPNTSENPLWVIAVAMAIFFPAAAVLIAMG